MIGVPVSAAKEMAKKPEQISTIREIISLHSPSPDLIPFSLGCEAVDIKAGPMSETYPPAKKPKNIETTMDPAADPAPKTENDNTPALVHMINMRLMFPK